MENYVLNCHGWDNLNLALITNYLCDIHGTSESLPNHHHLQIPHLQNHQAAIQVPHQVFVDMKLKQGAHNVLCATTHCLYRPVTRISQVQFIFKVCILSGSVNMWVIVLFFSIVFYCSQNIKFIV